jgi:DNA-binding transcriptional LysR family regulator
MGEIERIERRLKLHDVRVLMSVAEAGSMGKAAERLGTSQPAISRSISDLERALGVRLLDRGPRGIEPTGFGRAIIKRGIAVFDELRQGIKDIEFLADPTAGELRIGCTEPIAAGPCLAVIDRLTQHHPRLVFHVVTGPPSSLHRELTDRNVELVIAGITNEKIDEHLLTEKLFEDCWVIVAAAHNPLTRRRRINLAELARERWTLLPSGSHGYVGFDHAFVADAFRARGLEPPQVNVIAASLNMRNSLLATGRFLSVLPNFVLKQPGLPSLKALPVELPKMRRIISLITLRHRSLSPLAELFVETTRCVVKSLTP